jgi:hypothetical protein
MRVEDALRQVRTIQNQLALTQPFRCYRSATVAASGGLAMLAAAVQPLALPDPMRQLPQYLAVWIGVAALSVAVIGFEMLLRWWRSPSHHVRCQMIAAVRQFAPCVITGALLTWAIASACPQHAALLPGLWGIVFGLGIFASAIHLPPAGAAVAAYYLLAGLVCVTWGQSAQALQPWTMVITFGVGQALAAAALYGQPEADDEGPGE